MARMRERGRSDTAYLVTFDSLLTSTPFPTKLRALLSCLETAYGHPVEVEFTLNIDERRGQCLNLLQCRPYQTEYTTSSELPVLPYDRQIVFETGMSFMGGSVSFRADYLILVDPGAYSRLDQSTRYLVARTVGALNRLLGGHGHKLMFMGPGRWGTSTPSLGVPVSFAEICHAQALIEVGVPQEGFVPDLSFGTHFFHDLVETEIFYMVIPDADSRTKFRKEFFLEQPNRLEDLVPNSERWKDVIRVVESGGRMRESGNQIWLHADIVQQRALCWLRDAD
jgi:hypothetical protein